MDFGTYNYHYLYDGTTRELNADQIETFVADIQNEFRGTVPVYTDYYFRGDHTIYYIDSLHHDTYFRCGHGAIAKQSPDPNATARVTPRLDLSWFIPVGAEYDSSRDRTVTHQGEPEYEKDSETEEEPEDEAIVRFVTISDRLAAALERATVTVNQQEEFLTRYLERVEDQIINVLESLND